MQATYDLIADEMSEILGLDREEVMTRLKKTKSAYEVLAEKVEDDVADQIRAFIDENDLEGCLYLTADSKRYYPYSTMASQGHRLCQQSQRGRVWSGGPVQPGPGGPGREDHHRQKRLGNGDALGLLQLYRCGGRLQRPHHH